LVKGISRQVIVVHAPEPKLFEQAIFILNENTVQQGGVTDEMLLREAKKIIRGTDPGRKKKSLSGPLWACCGAGAMGLLWLTSLLL